MKRICKALPRVFLILLAVILLAGVLTGGLILHRGKTSGGTCSYLILLGTKVEGTIPSPMLRDRIQAAADYMKQHPETICIVTGGKADAYNISEAQCMSNELTALGIDSDRILMEDKAVSTVENFQFSRALLEEECGSTPQSVGILSSEFHLLRAGMLADYYGLEAITIPATTSDTKTFLTYFLREIFMVWYDGIRILGNRL